MAWFQCCNGAGSCKPNMKTGLFGRSCSEKDDHACSIDILAHGTGECEMADSRQVWPKLGRAREQGKTRLETGGKTESKMDRGSEDTMFKLFYAPNTCALASHIALQEAGADYETVRLNFGSNDQRKPEYLAINPKGRVPALVTDRGILTETPAILAFVAQSFPHYHLAPLDDAFAFARVQAFNSYLCSTVHVAHAHGRRGYRWVDSADAAAISAMEKKVPQAVAECFELIEREMFVGPWVMGDGYTICDPYLFTLAQWLEGDGVDPRRFPKVRDHGQRMLERSAVKIALAEESRLAEQG